MYIVVGIVFLIFAFIFQILVFIEEIFKKGGMITPAATMMLWVILMYFSFTFQILSNSGDVFIDISSTTAWPIVIFGLAMFFINLAIIFIRIMAPLDAAAQEAAKFGAPPKIV